MGASRTCLDQKPRTTSHGQGHKAECGELWHTWQCKQGVSLTILGTGCASVNDKRTPEMLEKHDNVMDWFDGHPATPVYKTPSNRDCRETLPRGCLTCQESQASRWNQPATVPSHCPEPKTETGQSKHPTYPRLGSADSWAPWPGQVSANFVHGECVCKVCTATAHPLLGPLNGMTFTVACCLVFLPSLWPYKITCWF